MPSAVFKYNLNCVFHVICDYITKKLCQTSLTALVWWLHLMEFTVWQ